jgi:class 3 adenylate cyclase
MFTDIEGSTGVSTVHGEETAVRLVRRHDTIVRDGLSTEGGREIKHTGDGILASFTSVSRAVEAPASIQRASAEERNAHPPLAIKIGLSAGEPVEDSSDLYGAAVNLAARICDQAHGGQILVSNSVRDLALGKGHEFLNGGSDVFKGFPDPVPLFEVQGRS